ncbi:hypothetical protein JG688_00005139 [Phytophthora aleatoria]|uniref:Uncharacterized protein n=1 Tax=Phytophthora aleatoria TaxID=2496075 RepID=A0A8J5M6T2_9STRA|nr:hypothetical protein JG688_00005139 [Phytophthora aleatoria]
MDSSSTSTSIVDMATDEFKHQRIESEEWFGDMGKAPSCRLMSKEHCRTSPSCRNCCATISGESVSEDMVNGSRYKVNLIVRGLNAKYAKLISMRLKEGFVASEDRWEMRIFVYVRTRMCFANVWSANAKTREEVEILL